MRPRWRIVKSPELEEGEPCTDSAVPALMPAKISQHRDLPLLGSRGSLPPSIGLGGSSSLVSSELLSMFTDAVPSIGENAARVLMRQGSFHVLAKAQSLIMHAALKVGDSATVV